LTFPGPVDAISYCSFRTEARNECTLIGSEGILSVSPAFNFQGTSKIKLTTQGQPDTVIVDCPNNYTLEIEQFGRCITDGEKPLISHESSLLTAQIMDKSWNESTRNPPD
jgi:predicted dehydrogenase